MTDHAGDAVLAQLTFESIEMLSVFQQTGSFKEVALQIHRDERTISRQLIDLDRAFSASHQLHILEREPQRRSYRLTRAGTIFVNSLSAISDLARNAISAAASEDRYGHVQTQESDGDRDASVISSLGSAHLERTPEAYQFLAAIVDNSDDAIVSINPEGRILSWNDAATGMYGYTADEAAGQPIEIVVPEDLKQRQEELDIRARIARGERIQHYETIRRRRDGTQFDVSLSMSPVRDAAGRILAAAGFARDISDRKALEAAQYQAAIVENSDDAIISTSLDGTILTWNDGARRMYGHTEEEVLHQPIDTVIPEELERRQEVLDIRARIARGERIQHYETIRQRRDGTQFDVSLSMSPVRDASGQVVAAAEFARDISERRRLEEERRRATGLLTRFADFSAHDFKTPMQHILWDCQAAAEALGPAAPPRVGQLLDRIIASSRWMQSRTEGLQAASGLTDGKSPARQRVLSQKAFDEAHRMLAAVDQFVQRATVTRDPLPRVVSNEVLLGFLFQNLLQNACKYGRVGVPVTVHVFAERLDGAWQFSVRDNGRGIAPDRLSSIFEPYVRGENVGADEPGSGIGLNFCRAIVEWHQGRIWAESGTGAGTTFHFTIPDLRVGNGQ